MKGMPGLILAAALGAVGAFCNWFYVTKQARDYEKVAFVAVKPEVQVNVGDKLVAEQFEKIEIPKGRLGNLEDVAVRWGDLETVTGWRAVRSYRGGEIVLTQDIQTPGTRSLSELLGNNEVAKWVPVDSRSFVPQRVDPGDMVSFTVRGGGGPAGGGGSAAPGRTASPSETIGPFRILALGTRTGRRETLQGSSVSSGSEYVVTIAVTYENSKMEAKAERLFDMLRNSGSQGAEVTLHSASTRTKPAAGAGNGRG